MGLILLILQIISAIPTVIQIVKEILELIHSLKGLDKRDAQAQLKSILSKHKKGGLKGEGACHACQKDLEELREYLKGKYGN